MAAKEKGMNSGIYGSSNIVLPPQWLYCMIAAAAKNTQQYTVATLYSMIAAAAKETIQDDVATMYIVLQDRC